MKIKPVLNWLLLKENKGAKEKFVGMIELPDSTKTIMTLAIADVIEAGPDVTECAVGETILFRADSPAMQQYVSHGELYAMLPSTHVVAKAVLSEAEA